MNSFLLPYKISLRSTRPESVIQISAWEFYDMRTTTRHSHLLLIRSHGALMILFSMKHCTGPSLVLIIVSTTISVLYYAFRWKYNLVFLLVLSWFCLDEPFRITCRQWYRKQTHHNKNRMDPNWRKFHRDSVVEFYEVIHSFIH